MEKLSKPELVRRLKHYIRFKDKNTPPYFAGRKKVLSDIEDACELSWEMHRAKGAGQPEATTRVIYGAPGAGKTSTLTYLKDCWKGKSYATADESGAARPQPAPRVYLLQSDSPLDDPEDFCRKLANVLAPGSGSALLDAVSRTERMGTDLNLGVIKAEGETETTRHSPAPAAALATVLKVLPPEQWSGPLVIAVDETQNLAQRRDCFAGKLFRELHANRHNAPITLVLGGLSDSIKRAGELGLTRLSKGCVHSLDRFDAEEVAELKQGFCAKFELDIGSREAEFDAMLAACDGWPAHLTNGLHAFCQVFLECDCDISRVDFAEVERISTAERNQYYAYRMSTAMRNTDLLLQDVMRHMSGRRTRREVIAIIKQQHQLHLCDEINCTPLPLGMSANDYFEELAHHGALQERDDGLVECPIPSFRQFILNTWPAPRNLALSQNKPEAGRSYRGVPETSPKTSSTTLH